MVRSSTATNQNFDVIKEELYKTGLVAAVTRSTAPITQIRNFTAGLEWKGMPMENQLIIAAMAADESFFKTINASIIQGREFSGSSPADTSAILLNKAAVEAMGLESPVGSIIRYNKRNYEVIGVTENIVMESPYRPVDPMMTMYSNKRSSHITIRVRENARVESALAGIESVFRKHNSAYPFEFEFVDKKFNEKFITEELIGNLTNTFAALAIFICCLGLFGLAAFSAEQRTKEIGIRKVLGANVSGLVAMMSKEFVGLIVIASLIAFPLAWYALNKWLQEFPYRVDISWWVFGVAGIAALLLALVTISSQAIKAALANPVKSLKNE